MTIKYKSIRHFPAGVLNKNWGDIINGFLFEKLAGIKPQRFPMGGPPTPKENPVLLMAGSVLPMADANTGVWGTGFIAEGGNCRQKPLKVYAVRGPLTREWLLKRKIPCPEVYGDPALVFPRFYKSQSLVQYELGIIPHYVDQQHPWVLKAKQDPRVKFIDILTDEPRITNFIDEVCSCRRILSSSLHGVIIADAYQIPSLWIEFSNKVLGNGFKFRDYFMSVGRQERKPIDFDLNTSIDDIIRKFYSYSLSFDIDNLLYACPLLETVE